MGHWVLITNPLSFLATVLKMSMQYFYSQRLIELSKKIDMKALDGNTKIAEEFKVIDMNYSLKNLFSMLQVFLS